MKKFLKGKKIIIYVLIIFLVILLVAILNDNFKIIEKITNGRLQNEDEETTEIPLITYQVYDNSDENKIKTLVTINDNSGIEYVEYPDGAKIYGNSKKKVTLDYIMEKNQNYTFKVKTNTNENIQEQTICANEEFVNNNGIYIANISSENGYKVIDIENKTNLTGFKTYYQIGKNGNWIEGTAKIGLTDYDLTTNNLINEDNTITINAKIENQTTKDVVSMTKKYEVETEPKTNSYNSESLLEALGKEDIDTGTYNVTVENETYNLKVYSFEGNLTIKGNTTLGTEEDVATASEEARNMVVLKVNGDLTVEEGATLTAYASKNGYGGPKGMTIYCTGTLTNNGTISMSARGAKAMGQDVYLWKNLDDTYEYVPEVGATGGDSVKSSISANDGENGTNRQTGGGSSGGFNYFGGGATGTSYSGGTAGGGNNGDVGGYASGGQANGASGGRGSAGNSSGYESGGGGAGNPGGFGHSGGDLPGWQYGWGDDWGINHNLDGKNGTGGLLIIFSKNVINTGNIEANGSSGGNGIVGGGSSGGGSINIFYTYSYENSNTIQADGGKSVGQENKGGAGGTGSISVGQILDGTYKYTYINYQDVGPTEKIYYTGSYSEYKAKNAGYYKIECWGARGRKFTPKWKCRGIWRKWRLYIRNYSTTKR